VAASRRRRQVQVNPPTEQSAYPAWFWQPHASPSFELPALRDYAAMTIPAAETPVLTDAI
jgi:hypothetical protein